MPLGSRCELRLSFPVRNRDSSGHHHHHHQALALLNSSLVDRQSEALADRVQRKHPNDETAQLHEIYQLIFQRDPSPPEESDAKPFVTEHGLQHFCVVLFNSSEFVYVD
jgi:hypothetical protein